MGCNFPPSILCEANAQRSVARTINRSDTTATVGIGCPFGNFFATNGKIRSGPISSSAEI